MFRSRYVVLLSIVAIAVALRLIDHPWNLAPIGALSLFAGAYFRDRRLAFILPLVTMFLSDIALGIVKDNLSLYVFFGTVPFVYGCYIFYVVLGEWVRGSWRAMDERAQRASASETETSPSGSGRFQAMKAVPVAAATLAGAITFFLVTNFGVWLLFYERTWAGLVRCFVAGVPYFRTTLAGDAVYVVILFGGYAVLKNHLAAPDERGLLHAE
jgi:hypothetical protein